MFIPRRKTGKIFRLLKKDVYGDKTHEKSGVSFGWAPVYVRDKLDDSSVRSDSSASRGRAEEKVADIRILMEPKSMPKNGDNISLDGGLAVEIVRVQERMLFNGKINHWEVDCATA